MYKIGVAGNVAEGSSPFSAAFGSETGSSAVKSRASATGEESQNSSPDKKGNTGRDVSSRASAFHPFLNPKTPTSVLAEHVMNTKCFIGDQSRSMQV